LFEYKPGSRKKVRFSDHIQDTKEPVWSKPCSWWWWWWWWWTFGVWGKVYFFL